ncbi:unnamed protein product [Polarella glacialis]|uniref:Tr-type G domain-containing protein n=1 Tax=Polarella glacialis TaxID=89957 RepID=A0A813EGV6_POLGL|nr:unnamed protein product [Polarella glacialis]
MACRALAPGESPASKIRNFSIIGHSEYEKSVFASSLLEAAGVAKTEEVEAQLLDDMEIDLEMESGITRKLNTARMQVISNKGEDFVLNLVDTPGRADFTYEVSCSLAACEGALLIIDATKGVQAQTIANYALAVDYDLKIIPVLSKVDLPTADCQKVSAEVKDAIGLDCSNAIRCSASSGLGLKEVISAIIDQVPPPGDAAKALLRMLVFDSFYDEDRGDIVSMVRVVDGYVFRGQGIHFMNSGKDSVVEELGIMIGGLREPVGISVAGEVGYLVSSVSRVDDSRIGETIVAAGTQLVSRAIAHSRSLTSQRFCGVFPEDGTGYDTLRAAFQRLALDDAAITYAAENSSTLGLGFRCGFVSMLHLQVDPLMFQQLRS